MDEVEASVIHGRHDKALQGDPVPWNNSLQGGCVKKLFIGAREDARYQGSTPLLAAADSDHTDVCELLLEKGRASIEEKTSDEDTALNIAAGEGFLSKVDCS